MSIYKWTLSMVLVFAIILGVMGYTDYVKHYPPTPIDYLQLEADFEDRLLYGLASIYAVQSLPPGTLQIDLSQALIDWQVLYGLEIGALVDEGALVKALETMQQVDSRKLITLAQQGLGEETSWELAQYLDQHFKPEQVHLIEQLLLAYFDRISQ